MKKSVLLAATAVLALAAGAASAGGLHPRTAVTGVKMSQFHRPCPVGCVWNQNSSANGGAIDSQNFTSGTFTTYDDAGADDFNIAAAAVVTGVDASGIYFPSSLHTIAATSFDVTFYKNTVIGGVAQPGAVVAAFANQAYTDTNGDFNIPLCTSYNKKGKCKKGKVKFKPGKKHTAATYWVSVVANCTFTGGCAEWGWDTRPQVAGTNPAVWENPGGGFALCPTWNTLGVCISAGYATDDFMFDLY